MGLYLSLSVYACSCLFLSVAVCFMHFPFVFHLLRIECIISIISFLVTKASRYIGLAEVIDASEASLGGPGCRPSQMTI